MVDDKRPFEVAVLFRGFQDLDPSRLLNMGALKRINSTARYKFEAGRSG